jgi:hypothetical protein
LVSVLLTLVFAAAWGSEVSPHLVAGVPRLDLQPPAEAANARALAFGEWTADLPALECAAALGRRAQLDKKAENSVLAPWRVQLGEPDRFGGFATLLAPEAVAALLGWQATERKWPEETVRIRLEDLRERFSGAICVFVELRSYPRVRRPLGRLGRAMLGRDYHPDVVLANPAECYQPEFLLDGGGPKWEPVVPNASEVPAGSLLTAAGIPYVRVALPPWTGRGLIGEGLERQDYERDAYDCFGADYFLWWSFADPSGKPAFGEHPPHLRLTITTPTRKQEVAFPLQAGAAQVNKPS